MHINKTLNIFTSVFILHFVQLYKEMNETSICYIRQKPSVVKCTKAFFFKSTFIGSATELLGLQLEHSLLTVILLNPSGIKRPLFPPNHLSQLQSAWPFEFTWIGLQIWIRLQSLLGQFWSVDFRPQPWSRFHKYLICQSFAYKHLAV